MSLPTTVYHLHLDDMRGPTFANIEDLMGHVKDEVAGGVFPGCEPLTFRVEAGAMTQEQFDTLPEFSGY